MSSAIPCAARRAGPARLEPPAAAVQVLMAAEYALPAPVEAAWLARLPPERRAVVGRWPDPRDRHRSLLGTRLLSVGLSRLAIPPAALAALRHAPGARPTLAGGPHFSLSHCDGLVVCAIAEHGPVGIDVEALGALTAADFRLYLSAPERAWAGADPRRFYIVWTRKEAVAKAAGTNGLPALRAVDTATAGRRRAALAGRLWRTAALPVGRGHVAHLALADAASRIRCERLERSVLEAECEAGCEARPRSDGDA